MAKKIKQLKHETAVHAFIKKYFMIIVVLAITLIPSIYTVLFLGSMWDPYGNTGNLPVAIVNEDKPIYYDGKTVNIGEQLCNKLKQNKSLQFNFVDEEAALNGLENSTFYMVMVIPDDFSANSVTLTSEHPQKMELEYYVNPGTNYIASKFGESAVKSIKEQINKTVINTYATTIYGKLGTIHDGFVAAADGSGQIGDGVGQLKDGNKQITKGLETLSNGCLTLKEGTGTLKDGLAQYTDGAQQIADGMTQLHDGVPQLTDGVGQLKDGTGQLVSGTGQLKDGAKQLTDNSDKLNDGAQQLLDGLNLMSDQLGESLTEENLNDLATLEDGLIQLNDGIQTLQKAINEDYRISDDKLAKIQKDINDADALIQTDSFKMLCRLISYSDLDYDEILRRIDSLELIASDEEKKVLETLKTYVVMLEDVQDLRKLVTPENAQKLVDAAKKVLGAYEQLTSGVQQLSDGGNLALPVASDTLKKMTSGLQSVKNGLDRTVENDGETGLIEGMGTLRDGIDAYTSGVSQVSDGIDQLDDGAIRLDDGMGQLSVGLSTAGEGIDKLYNGAQTLVSNNDKLNGGAGQLDDGAGQLYDGSLKLLDGSNQIGDGCDKLLDGAHLLESSLRDGAVQIENTNTGADAAEMFSQPVDANETFQRTINTNGEAMSAYMMCAGLWVACLAFCLMFSPFNTSLKNRKTFRRHGIIAAFVAVVAPIIMVTLIMGIDGMRPAHVIETYVMAILTSCAFMAIVYMVNTMFDSIGSFMLLIFLCLQLSGAAGTYPIELSPKFYQIIHPFMPFTYGVDAFRSTISTGNSLVQDITVFVLIALTSFGLTQVTYHLRQIKLQHKAQTEAERAMEEEVDYYNHAV